MKVIDMKRCLPFILLICSFSILFSGILSHIIYYHEQHQLFLFSDVYFHQNLNSLPGGLLNYITAFVVQFFYNPTAGGILFSLFLAATYLLSSILCTKITGNSDQFQFSLLTPLLLLVQYTTIEFPISATIGIFLCQFISILYLFLPRKTQPIFSFPLALAAYMLSGGYCLIFILIAIINTIYRGSKREKWLILLWLIFASSFPFIGSFFYDIPIEKAITGVLPESIKAFSILLLMLILPIFAAQYITPYFSKNKKIKTVLTGSLLLCYVLTTCWLFSRTYDNRTRLMLQVDNYVKKEDWNSVLKYTAQYNGKNHLVTYLTNLALYHTHQMPEKMFTYPQNWGTESLFFPWTGNSRESEYGDLVYAGLGYLNDAHRWTFESMTVFGETAPLLQKLVRYNIANNRPLVAQRFINILKQSLFYREWANKMEEKIRKHEQLSMHRADDDSSHPARFSNFLDLGPDLLYLCNREPENRMAFEYLMSYYLISNQVVKFAENLGRIQAFSNSKLPDTYEEALLIYKLGVPEETFRQIGMDVQPETMERFKRYYQLLQDKSKKQQQLKSAFGNTYWYYMNFESPYGSKIINNERP